MAQSYLIFDFGGNEETAQQARHKLENWRQAFRLDRKLLLRFDRGEASPAPAEGNIAASGRVVVMVRLDFSDHEKLSHQRWLDRIPGEEPFKSASPQTVRPGDSVHAATAERFDALGDEHTSRRDRTA
jgi:hypothetical protein